MLALAQGPQEPGHLRVLALAQGPQEPAQKSGHLPVRLMESPQLGELLGSLPEAVVFPESYHQEPPELAHFRV